MTATVEILDAVARLLILPWPAESAAFEVLSSVEFNGKVAIARQPRIGLVDEKVKPERVAESHPRHRFVGFKCLTKRCESQSAHLGTLGFNAAGRARRTRVHQIQPGEDGRPPRIRTSCTPPFCRLRASARQIIQSERREPLQCSFAVDGSKEIRMRDPKQVRAGTWA